MVEWHAMRERFARRWVSALQNGSCASEMKPELVTKALVSGVFIAIKSSRVDSLDVQQNFASCWIHVAFYIQKRR